MKKIGLIRDKKNSRVFLLPESVKQITSSGITVYVPRGYASKLGISDADYGAAGAYIVNNNNYVIARSDIVCKVEAFNKKEINSLKNKTAITMANYVANVDMLYQMLKNNVKGYAWKNLTKGGHYVFFPEIEKLKGLFVAKELIKNKVKPKVLILNAAWAGQEAMRILLANNMDVTLLDNDSKYLSELKNSEKAGSHLHVANAKYETLTELFPKHHAFIYTCPDPFSLTKPRITGKMAESMPQGSILIDAACENGYGFQFQKKLLTSKLVTRKIGKSNFLCPKDISELYPKEYSQIVSVHSAEYLKLVANDKTESLSSILICKDGQVVNKYVNKQLCLN